MACGRGGRAVGDFDHDLVGTQETLGVELFGANFMPSDAGTPTKAAPPVRAWRMTILRSAAYAAWAVRAMPAATASA